MGKDVNMTPETVMDFDTTVTFVTKFIQKELVIEIGKVDRIS